MNQTMVRGPLLPETIDAYLRALEALTPSERLAALGWAINFWHREGLMNALTPAQVADVAADCANNAGGSAYTKALTAAGLAAWEEAPGLAARKSEVLAAELFTRWASILRVELGLMTGSECDAIAADMVSSKAMAMRAAVAQGGDQLPRWGFGNGII